MKYLTFLIFFMCTIFINTNIYAQTKAVITIDEVAETEAGMLVINYSIENNKSNELFDIELEVKKGNETISVETVSGDVGENITGEGKKTLEWNMLKDRVILNENVDVQLIANAHEDISQLTMANLLLSSTLLPGAGLKRLDRTRPYKIMGFTGYALIGTAFLTNVVAKSNYDKYNSELTDLDLRDDYYSKATSFRIYTNICIFSAIGIWFVDYLWVYLKKKQLDKRRTTFFMPKNNFKIGDSYNSIAKEPMLNLQFNFYFLQILTLRTP